MRRPRKLFALRRCFENSLCVSCGRWHRGIRPALSPTSAKSATTPKLNYGMGICKYHRRARQDRHERRFGAETVGNLRRIFAEAGVVWQMSGARQGRSGRRRHRRGLHGAPQHRHHRRRRSRASACMLRLRSLANLTASLPTLACLLHIKHNKTASYLTK